MIFKWCTRRNQFGAFLLGLGGLIVVITQEVQGGRVGSYHVYRRDSFALLTGTLRTFQRAACEGEWIYIKCPTGTKVSIQLAQYGKNAKSPWLCTPHPPIPPQVRKIINNASAAIFPSNESSLIHRTTHNIRHGSRRLETEKTKVTCLWPSAIQKVVAECQNERTCQLQSSSLLFGGDPCPGMDDKYTEVAYKCRPYEFESRIGCEWEVMNLTCNPNKRVAIYSAVYGKGKYEINRCTMSFNGLDVETDAKSCAASFATEIVMQICHGKRSCIVTVDRDTFGNPCPFNVTQYLKLVYTCIPKIVFKEKYQTPMDVDEWDSVYDYSTDFNKMTSNSTSLEYTVGEKFRRQYKFKSQDTPILSPTPSTNTVYDKNNRAIKPQSDSMYPFQLGNTRLFLFGGLMLMSTTVIGLMVSLSYLWCKRKRQEDAKSAAVPPTSSLYSSQQIEGLSLPSSVYVPICRDSDWTTDATILTTNTLKNLTTNPQKYNKNRLSNINSETAASTNRISLASSSGTGKVSNKTRPSSQTASDFTDKQSNEDSPLKPGNMDVQDYEIYITNLSSKEISRGSNNPTLSVHPARPEMETFTSHSPANPVKLHFYYDEV